MAAKIVLPPVTVLSSRPWFGVEGQARIGRGVSRTVWFSAERQSLASCEILGPSTMNIGLIAGGRAPNVIPDAAKAELLIRLVDDGDSTVSAIREACSNLAEVVEVLRIPAVLLGGMDGFDTMVASYTTDIPAFQGNWGQPYLFGPGTIHVAHTSEERMPKKQLLDAVAIYQQMVRTLLERCHPVLK